MQRDAGRPAGLRVAGNDRSGTPGRPGGTPTGGGGGQRRDARIRAGGRAGAKRPASVDPSKI
jgi:hypothetical protein